MNRDQKKGGMVYGLLSAIFLGFHHFLVSSFSEGIPHTEMAFARGLFITLILLPWTFRFVPLAFHSNAKVLWLRSISGTIAMICFFYTLAQVPVGDAAAIGNLSGLFVVFLSWLFLGEKISIQEWIGVVAVVFGVTLLRSPMGSSISWEVLLIGLLGAFGASLAYISLRSAAQRFPAVLIIWLFGAVTSVVTYVAPSIPWVVPREREFLIFLGVGSFGLGGQWCMTQAYLRLSAPIACALILSSVVWGVVFESLFCGDLPSSGSFLSYAIILFGVYVLQTGQFFPIRKRSSAE